MQILSLEKLAVSCCATLSPLTCHLLIEYALEFQFCEALCAHSCGKHCRRLITAGRNSPVASLGTEASLNLLECWAELCLLSPWAVFQISAANAKALVLWLDPEQYLISCMSASPHSFIF